MAAALQERCSLEVLGSNEAIEALKKENKRHEAEKARLSAEVNGLTTTRAEAENLQKECEDLLKRQIC